VGDCVIAVFTDAAGPQVMVALGGIVMLPSVIFYMSIKGSLPDNERTPDTLQE
jgi:hypothetical protein